MLNSSFGKIPFHTQNHVFCVAQGQTFKYDRLAHLEYSDPPFLNQFDANVLNNNFACVGGFDCDNPRE